MSTGKKLLKVLAIVVAALQIPLLMLWNITIDAFRTSASEIKFTEGGYDLVFQWDKVINAILSYLPILLALAVCLVMTVLGLIFILRQKRATILTVCFYAITVFSCGFLYLAFAAPAIIVGEANAPRLMLSEFIFFRYFGGMELRIVSDIFPLLETIKFFFLGLLMAGSGALCGLEIADLIHPQAVPASMETELCESREQTTEPN
jgi:hypothetical protein